MKKTISLIIFMVFLLSCGETPPTGTTITFEPSELKYDSLAGDVCSLVTVIVKKDNIPLGGIKVYISGSFASPRTPARYEFHKNSTCNEPVASPFSLETDDLGTRTFSIYIYSEVNGQPNSFKDTIEARAGDAYAQLPIEVGGEQ